MSGSKAASWTGMRGSRALGWVSYESPASGMPAARSFWRAPLAAPASRACCHTLAARPSAAASSASRVIGGSRLESRRAR
ncbi:hypothetical protein STANM309S_04854 [Streptomyces tanashiensis]